MGTLGRKTFSYTGAITTAVSHPFKEIKDLESKYFL